jgi:hypothetical protein
MLSGANAFEISNIQEVETEVALPTEEHLRTSAPTGPESVQHNPHEPVTAVEVQAARGVLASCACLALSRRAS